MFVNFQILFDSHERDTIDLQVTTPVNYPVLKDRACKSPIDQPQLS